MAVTLKEMCRLCAKIYSESKDLLDNNNVECLLIIEDLLKLTPKENDDLPTKICLHCEEKLVSFNSFLAECRRVQNFYRKLIEKPGDEEIDYTTANPHLVESGNVKPEVKQESSIDHIETHHDDFLNYGSDDMNVDDDLMDEMTLASLKDMKKKISKEKKKKNKQDKEESHNKKKKCSKISPLIRFECPSCLLECTTWLELEEHYKEKHPEFESLILNCDCGYIIKSQSSLYRHSRSHQQDQKNVKDYVQFICHICTKTFKNFVILTAHCKKKHNTKPSVICLMCGAEVNSVAMLYKHINYHKNPDMYFPCKECPKILLSVEAQIRHAQKHEKGTFICSTCNREYDNKTALKSHLLSHIPIEQRKNHCCDCCSMKFVSRSSLMSHKRVVHENVRPFICDLCGYTCGTNGELKQHRAIHSKERPFTCAQCSKSFKTYSNYKTHTDTHEGTSYECYVCHRILNSRRTYRKHLLVHQNECRHVCSYCSKAFKRRQTLKTHLTTHTGDKPHLCKWCDERFAYASTLRSHRLRFHADKMVPTQKPPPVYNTQYLQPAQSNQENLKNNINNDNHLISKIEFSSEMMN